MKFTSPGKFPTISAFREYLLAQDPEFPIATELADSDGPLAQPLVVDHDGRRVGNRFVVQPMEGWDATKEGLPSVHTRRRWNRFGQSGAKLVWGGEAFAVQEDGRANPNQLYMNPEANIHDGLSTLRAEILDGHCDAGLSTEDLYIGLQLTHSGRFSRPYDGAPVPRMACANPIQDPRMRTEGIAVVSDTELQEIAANFVRAAVLAQSVGFDFVDVKCCHGYLLHELLGAHTRPGPYGGSFENRTRLFREIVAGIRTRCPSLGIGVRVSIVDLFPHSPDSATGIGGPAGWQDHVPYRYGFGVDSADPRVFDLGEPFQFLRLIEELRIRLVNITIGSPYSCPHLQRPAAYPPSDGYLPPEDPLLSALRHLHIVRECKAAFPKLLLVGTAYSYFQEWLPYMAEYEVGQGHADFVGLGRIMLSYPQLPFDVLHGRPLDKRRICRTFSDCTTGPRLGLRSGCYPLDSYYRSMDDARRIKEFKRKKRTT